MNKKYHFTVEQLKDAVQKSKSLANTCRLLGVKPVGGNYKTVMFHINTNSIDISHFTGQGWNVGNIGLKFKRNKYSIEEIFIKNSPYKSPSKLKEKLIEVGLKERRCERCENEMWLGKPIKLEIHHINGINTDNRIENLEILCPNCHAYTDNFRGKNQKRSALSEKREVEYRKFREALTENADGNPEPSPNREGAETLHGKPKFVNISFCKTCNKSFKQTSKNKTFCCVDCYRTYNHNTVPTPGEIFEAFDNYKSFLQVGKYFKVSDNAVRKWCDSYGITDMVKRKSRPQTE